MMDATALVSMLNTDEIVGAVCRGKLPPSVGDCEDMPPLVDSKESRGRGGVGGKP